MVLRRSIFLLILASISIFLVTTNFLLTFLPPLDTNRVEKIPIKEKIQWELAQLPSQYKTDSFVNNRWIESFLKNTRKKFHSNLNEVALRSLWEEANSWVSPKQLYNVNSTNFGKVLFALKNADIVQADIDTRGTQLKILLTLQGNQQVVFKPKWYSKDKVIEGSVTSGKDRYNSEIIGFYLSVIMKKPLCPLSVQRHISLKNDIIPVATERLLSTSFKKNNKTCIFGKCFYCKMNDSVCDDENSGLTGAIIFNIKGNLEKFRSPWQRTYKSGKTAIWEQYPEKYCKSVKEKMPKSRLYDLIDVSIFDFLIQNGDRHHYETLGNNVIWLDNGKGLGNPYIHHIDILAPLYQCCMLRKYTWKSLLELTGGKIKQNLELMPDIQTLTTQEHLTAIEERLLLVFATFEFCRHKQNDESLL
ncbi:unnamed protein product [Phaedon cochleariae]|uniref:FAM20 C-terminal domain-containing protein n=1 Tax=Phaedon cochleariae TaxID=80249 RepID=A0A9P0DPY4_PHACE|nr:unnamed protein product [Phaedon cochleariae]